MVTNVLQTSSDAYSIAQYIFIASRETTHLTHLNDKIIHWSPTSVIAKYEIDPRPAISKILALYTHYQFRLNQGSIYHGPAI